MSTTPKKVEMAKCKNGHVRAGDKVAIIGRVEVIQTQHDNEQLQISIDDSGGPLFIDPKLVEKIG